MPLALNLTWQAASRFGLVAPEVLPSPRDIVSAFAELFRLRDLRAALPVSLSRARIGLAIGLFPGLWRIGEGIFDVPLQMLRTIPLIAAVPLFITWFGIDEMAKLIIIIEAPVFPMYLNSYAGARGVDPKRIEAAAIFGLSHRLTARHVILPTAGRGREDQCPLRHRLHPEQCQHKPEFRHHHRGHPSLRGAGDRHRPARSRARWSLRCALARRLSLSYSATFRPPGSIPSNAARVLFIAAVLRRGQALCFSECRHPTPPIYGTRQNPDTS